MLFAPGAPATVGKDNIPNYFKPLLTGPSLHFTVSDVHIDVPRSGDLTETEGSFEITGTDAKGKPTRQKVRDRGEQAARRRVESRRGHQCK